MTMLLYYGTPDGALIAPEMWKLFPQMLYMIAGNDGDIDGGYAFEFLANSSPCIQNFISKDP